MTSESMSYPIEFKWDGSQYIDVLVFGKSIEVINVGEYTEAGVNITIKGREEFMAVCERWIGEQTAEQMRNWRYDAIGYPKTPAGKERHLTPVPGATPVYDDDGNEIVTVATCGNCGRSWNDAAVSSVTPAPSARCPFEYDHA